MNRVTKQDSFDPANAGMYFEQDSKNIKEQVVSCMFNFVCRHAKQYHFLQSAKNVSIGNLQISHLSVYGDKLMAYTYDGKDERGNNTWLFMGSVDDMRICDILALFSYMQTHHSWN